jgi:hypothetical protein
MTILLYLCIFVFSLQASLWSKAPGPPNDGISRKFYCKFLIKFVKYLQFLVQLRQKQQTLSLKVQVLEIRVFTYQYLEVFLPLTTTVIWHFLNDVTKAILQEYATNQKIVDIFLFIFLSKFFYISRRIFVIFINNKL